MNILQQQNSAKELSDQQLQQELLNPTGALPSYLALSELQRRKDMRASYQSLQGKPGSSMAEEFARGLGGADVGKYGEAVRGAMPSSPGGEQPPMPMQPPMQAPMQPPMQPPMQDPMQQQFAAGGAVMDQKARGATMAPDDILAGFKKDDGTFNPAALGPLAGVIGGQSLGDSMKGFANAALIGPGLRLLGVKGFADGGAIMAPGATKAVGASMATTGNNNNQNNNSSPPWPRKDEKDILGGFKKEDGSFNPAALGPLAGIIAGQSVGDSFKGFANSMVGPVPRLMGFKGFADGGPVHYDNGGVIYGNTSVPDLWRMITGQIPLPSSSGNNVPAITGPFSSVEAANAQEALRPTKAPLAPSGTLSGQTTIEDILNGIGVTNQRLGIAGASNMNPYEQAPRIDTFGGADSGGPGTGSASDSGTSSSNSAAADASAADAGAAAAGAAAAGASGDDGTGGGTGGTYYRGGVVGLKEGGDPGSFYRDFSNRREDNRLDYLDAIRERIKQNAPRGGIPPINPYGNFNPYVATAVRGGPYDLGETVETAVSKLASQDRWSNPRGNYFPGPNNYSKPYGTARPGPTPTPMGYGVSYAYPETEAAYDSGSYQYPKTRKEAVAADAPDRIRMEDPNTALPNRRWDIQTENRKGIAVAEPPPAVNAFSFLPPQSTYVPFNPNNPDPVTGNSYGPNEDEAAFRPGPIPSREKPVVRGANPPAGKGSPTPPPGGGISDARGPGGGAGGGGGGAANGGVGAVVNPDLAGFMGDIRALQLPDRFGEIEARNQKEREDLKAGRETDKGLAMLQAGMTMAGGTSPYALANISAGATAGIKEWGAAEKEFRVANQAIRSAENAIQIARANRDEKQLEMGVRVKMHFEEIKEKAAARREAAAAAAGARSDAAAARADAMADNKEHRALVREQDEIKGLSDSYTKVQSHITSLGPKIAAAEAQVMAGEPGAKESRDVLKDQLNQYIQQRDAAYNMYQNSLLDRAGRKNNATVVRSKAEYNALPDGTRFLDASTGDIAIKKSKKQ